MASATSRRYFLDVRAWSRRPRSSGSAAGSPTCWSSSSSALIALRYFGVDPTAALAGLGIGGIAVALAAQKTLENVIGGLSLIFDKAVRVGDSLKLGEAVGTVDSIGLRSTRIRTLDRTILSIPNGQMANVSLETLSVRDKCWFHHIVGLQYETTSAQMRHVIDAIRERLVTDPAGRVAVGARAALPLRRHRRSTSRSSRTC